MDPAIQTVNAVPSLDEIARDPGCIGGLPTRTLAALSSRAVVVQAALAAAQLEAAEISQIRPLQSAPAADRTLDADGIAEALGRTRRWVFRNAGTLPFVRRISRKGLVASETALRRWRDAQKP